MSINSIQELFDVSKQELEGKSGTISINFAGKTHIYTGNDVIGNCLQEWLPDWFDKLGVDIIPGASTQKFPDFEAQFGDKRYAVEVKAWNILASPAFDIANFGGFLETTFANPNKLNAYYFILGYSPKPGIFQEGFTVEKLYLKRIWEITSSTHKYPVGLQVKRKQPYALRPYNFHRGSGTCFGSRIEFIEAVRDAFMQFPHTVSNFTPAEWFEKVTSYAEVE